ncbi:MAG TPA: rhodanese-like domain-containing protein [Flavobacteriaceae bacterium]|nr:rhodanese-like domain-containing protein [Flavobacteriaceae bacterium]
MGLFGMFGGGNNTDAIKDYLEKGAVILDVRTPAEWAEGHTKSAKLITLNDIPQSVEKIKAWNKPVIVVCKSGGRAGTALSYLQQAGIDAINGGGWQNADI